MHTRDLLSPWKSQLFIVKENIFPLEFLFLILIRSLFEPSLWCSLATPRNINHVYTHSLVLLHYSTLFLFFFLLFFQFAKRVTGCTFIQSTETCLSKHEYPPLDKMLWIYETQMHFPVYYLRWNGKMYRKSKIDYVWKIR